jgi:hypothetical protein
LDGACKGRSPIEIGRDCFAKEKGIVVVSKACLELHGYAPQKKV